MTDDPHAVPMPKLDEFIAVALHDLGKDPFLILPEHREHHLREIVKGIIELRKRVGFDHD